MPDFDIDAAFNNLDPEPGPTTAHQWSVNVCADVDPACSPRMATRICMLMSGAEVNLAGICITLGHLGWEDDAEGVSTISGSVQVCDAATALTVDQAIDLAEETWRRVVGRLSTQQQAYLDEPMALAWSAEPN